jgi:aquaporin Z
MRKYLMEFIGTFFLVLTIGCTVIPGDSGVIPPLAIGSVLMAMIFAGGYISGAHYNPAVTLAVWIRGRLEKQDVLPYMIAQVTASVVAALVVSFLVGTRSPMIIKNIPAALLSEFLFTFALAFVVLKVATAKGTSGNSFYGLAIGMTVMGGAFARCRRGDWFHENRQDFRPLDSFDRRFRRWRCGGEGFQNPQPG